MAGHRQRGVPAQVLLDQGQCQVDAAGHPGRRNHIAVAHEDRFGQHLDVREPPGHGVAIGPVGGDGSPGQQPGLSEQERPRADGYDLRCAGCALAKPADQFCAGLASSFATRHQEQTARPLTAKVSVGGNREAAGGAHRAAAQARRRELVEGRPAASGAPAVRPGQHFRRTRHIECLHPVEQHDEHIPGGHGDHAGRLPPRPQCRKSQY